MHVLHDFPALYLQEFGCQDEPCDTFEKADEELTTLLLCGYLALVVIHSLLARACQGNVMRV